MQSNVGFSFFFLFFLLSFLFSPVCNVPLSIVMLLYTIPFPFCSSISTRNSPFHHLYLFRNPQYYKLCFIVDLLHFHCQPHIFYLYAFEISDYVLLFQILYIMYVTQDILCRITLCIVFCFIFCWK